MTNSQKIQIENLDSLKNQIAYSSDVLLNRINEMEDWEVKEFICINKQYQEEYNNVFLLVESF
jgi:hypothetical protein